MAGANTSPTESFPLPNLSTVSTQAAAAPVYFRHCLFSKCVSLEHTRHRDSVQIRVGDFEPRDASLAYVSYVELARRAARSIKCLHCLALSVVEQTERITTIV